jgi:hypothetical protein
MDDWIERQKRVCLKWGVEFVGIPASLKVGIARNANEGIYPLNGLRHPPVGDVSGWYIWAGETLSSDPDFFVPLHVEHLEQRCPGVLPYLALPPGWRFLVSPGYEDVWFDAALLSV